MTPEPRAEFFSLRKQWVSMMAHDNPSSIWAILHSQLWDDTAFRTINEAVKMSAECHGGKAHFNGMTFDLLARGYVTMQTMNIRKLIEQNFKDPTREVFSLRRIVKEISDNRNLITRHTFVTVDGYPYDDEASFSAWASQRCPSAGVSVDSIYLEPKDDWSQANSLHKAFDDLSGTNPSSRRRDDLIHPETLKTLSAALETCVPIQTMTHKLIAHNASPNSRAQANSEHLKVTLDAIEKANEALCSVAAFLYCRVLQVGGVAGVPMPQSNHLEFLSDPLVSKAQQKTLRKWWDNRVELVNAWTAADDTLELRLAKFAIPRQDLENARPA